MTKIRAKGSFDYKPEGKIHRFAAMEVSELIHKPDKMPTNYRALTNVEIVVYGYIITTYYDKRSRRVLFNDTINLLADYINIDEHSVSKAINSLLDLGMLIQLKGGITAKKTSKKNYIAVPQAFLVSPIVTTAQKAFILRIAALKKEGAITEVEVTGTSIAKEINSAESTVRKSIKSLIGVEDAPWLTLSDNILTVDYDYLKEMVINDFVDYYLHDKKHTRSKKHVAKGERLKTQLQVKYGINNKAKRKGSERKRKLILKLEELKKHHLADKVELLRAEKYIKQSRLTNAEKILINVEKDINNE